MEDHTTVFPNYVWIHAQRAAFMATKKKKNATGRFCQRSVYISLGYQFQHTQAQSIGCIIVIDLYAIITH